MSDNWVNLHSHTVGSILDGITDIKDMFKRAAELGQPAASITDHGNVHLLLDAYDAGQEVGIKSLLGQEFYGSRKSRFDQDEEERAGKAKSEFEQRGPYHLIALANNNIGYHNLLKLSSEAFLSGYYVKPRVDKDLLSKHSQGLTVLSGCLAGEVCQALLRNDFKAALNSAGEWQEIVGKDYYHIEVQNHGLPEQIQTNPQLVDIARRIGARVVATGDTHYCRKEDAYAHDLSLCVSTHALVSEENRFRFHGDNFYLKSYDEMREWAEPEWLANTLLVAEQCEVNLEKEGYHFPEFPIPEGETLQSYFEKQVWEGLRRRYGSLSERVVNQAEHEIGVISRMGFPAYFLIVADLISWAREHNIRTGPSRGSAGACIVSYALGITDTDPLFFNLSFSRFLVEGKKSMPDIDIDIDDRYRDQVIEYARQKYGSDHVTHICTFGRLGAKAAIRDAARVLEKEYSLGDKLSKLVPPAVFGVTKTLEEALQSPDMRKEYEANPEAKEVIDAAKGLEGLIRQTGIHAAGVVISPGPATEPIPVMQKGPDAPVVSQWEMSRIEGQGLLKIDFLGLRNLGILDMARANIKRTKGIDINLLDLHTFDDPKTFDILCAGQSIGVFQLESAPMRKLMVAIQPRTITDIMDLIALYRPGPMGSGMDKAYVNRKNGTERVAYYDPRLTDILEPTKGLMIYQEQILRIAWEFAGFTVLEGDDLRKCIPKGSKVLTSERGYRPIEELMSLKNPFIQTIDTEGFYSSHDEVEDVWSVGVKPVWEIETSSGFKVRATADHEFFTDDSWKKLSEFSEGDLIAVANHTRTEGGSKIGSAEIILAGLILSEGYCPADNTNFYFCNSDPFMMQMFFTAFEQFFGYSYDKNKVYQQGPVYYARMTVAEKQALEQSLYKFGLSGDRIIGDYIINAPMVRLREFVGAYYSGDGFTAESGCHIASKSEQVVRAFKRIFLRFGISSTVYTKFNTEYQRDYWTVSICDKGDCHKFKREFFDYLSPYKQEQLLTQESSWPSRPNAGRMGIPGTVFCKELERRATVTNRTKRNLGVDSGALFNQKLIHKDNVAKHFLSEKLTDIGDGDLIWDSVKSIVYLGEIECFDFSMKNSNRPYALVEDVLTHNCVGKKLTDKIKVFRTKFIEGCVKTSGASEALANKIFDDIEQFGDYGFPMAHSAGYATISYYCAWLKAHYPAEYMAALLTSVGSGDRLGLYITECKAMGIDVKPPSINKSNLDFTVISDTEILFGFLNVDGIGNAAAEKIINVDRNYTSVYDFMRRCHMETLNKSTLENLVNCGALDELIPEQPLRIITRQENSDILAAERKSLGAYVTAHPVHAAWDSIVGKITYTIDELSTAGNGEFVTVGGLLLEKRKIVTRRGATMYALVIEDVTGAIEGIVFPRQVRVVPDDLEQGDIILLSGRVDREGDDENVTLKLIVEELSRPELSHFATGESIVLQLPKPPDYNLLDKIASTIEVLPGTSYVYLEFPEGRHKISLRCRKPTSLQSKTQLEYLIKENHA